MKTNIISAISTEDLKNKNYKISYQDYKMYLEKDNLKTECLIEDEFLIMIDDISELIKDFPDLKYITTDKLKEFYDFYLKNHRFPM